MRYFFDWFSALLLPIWFLQAFICIIQPSKWFGLTLSLGNAKKNAIECLNASLKFSGLLSVDLISAAPTLTFMFSRERRRKAEKKNEGPCAMRFTLCATLFYKRLHQRPHTLYFLVGPGLAMIIPDMNSSTTISKLIFDITITISAFFSIIDWKWPFFWMTFVTLFS